VADQACIFESRQSRSYPQPEETAGRPDRVPEELIVILPPMIAAGGYN
jgi:hypothetical protein